MFSSRNGSRIEISGWELVYPAPNGVASLFWLNCNLDRTVCQKKKPCGAQISQGAIFCRKKSPCRSTARGRGCLYGRISWPSCATWRHFMTWWPNMAWIGSLWLLTSWCSVRLKQNTSRKLSRLLPGLWDITFGRTLTKMPPARFWAIISYRFPYKNITNRWTASTDIFN